jgi:heat shock protein HslJ
MLIRKSIFISLAVLITSLITGCGPVNIVPVAGPGSTPPLPNTEWRLTGIDGEDPLEGAEVTLSFDETTAGGSSGCNSYGGDYIAGADGSLSFGEIVQTLILCTEPEGVMKLEEKYINTLRLADSYRVDNDRLEIMNQSGTTILEYARQ